MKVIIKNVNESPKVEEIENTLEDLQKIVGGYIEIVPTDLYMEGIATICNEEGKIMGLEPNVRIGYDVVCGNMLFVGVDGEDFIDLTDEQIMLVMDMFM